MCRQLGVVIPVCRLPTFLENLGSLVDVEGEYTLPRIHYLQEAFFRFV